MKPITKETRLRAIKYFSDGLSNRKIAAIIGVDSKTVDKIAREVYPDRIKCKGGQPKKLTERGKQFCVRKITIGKQENAVSVQKSLKNELDVDVSAQTVRNYLKSAGLQPIVKPKKPLLSKKNIKSRLSWAKAHVDWTIADWKRVVWSDETKIDRFGSDGQRYAWKRESEPLQPRHVNQTVKHGGGNLKLWSCITYEGVGWLVRIDENLTKEIYKTILEDDLQKTIEEYGINPAKMIFQHDNDPKHTSKLVGEYLSKQPYDVMDWPAQSPDLNPIENMWSTLKRNLFSQYDRPPNGMLELWERATAVWYKITKQECQNVINSMPDRCKAVIKAKGMWTKY